jgi:predicted peptidase
VTFVRIICCVLALSAVGNVRAAETGFLQKTLKCRDGQTVKYSIFVPHDYSPDRPPPVVLFLHGAGQAGIDGQRQTMVGLGKAVRAREKSFPAIVVFPQAQKRERDILSTWSVDRPEGARALEILDAVQRDYRTDLNRVYLTGVSMGGYGTWALAARCPEKWAAIVPICGGGDRESVAAFKQVPCWCFHGADDPAVRVANSRLMIEALKKAGGDPKYTEYGGVQHNCWDMAYSSDDLWNWLWDQRRK